MVSGVDKMAKKRKPGRPAKGAEAKRGAFTFRVTDTMRARLEAAAAAHGRSVSEEVERRLESDALLGAFMGGPLENAELLRLIARVLMAEPKWKDDDEAYEAVQTAIGLLVKGCRHGQLTPEDINAVPGERGRLRAFSIFNSQLFR
jgi:plasmid stability protein